MNDVRHYCKITPVKPLKQYSKAGGNYQGDRRISFEQFNGVGLAGGVRVQCRRPAAHGRTGRRVKLG